MGSYRTYLRITVKVLAKKSGKCEETVRRHIKAGKFNPYSFDSINAWLDKVGRVEEENLEDDKGEADV